MLFGCIYTLVGKYIKIRAFNAVSCLAGMLLFVIDGIFINTLFSALGFDSVNAMFLEESPLPQYPWLSVWLLGALALLLLFGALALYEQLVFPKEERWYSVLKTKIQTKKGR